MLSSENKEFQDWQDWQGWQGCMFESYFSAILVKNNRETAGHALLLCQELKL